MAVVIPPTSCDVSDACDELDVAAVRSGALMPVWQGFPPVAGRLRTVRLEPSEGASSPLSGLLEVLADAADALVLVDLGGRRHCQCWGSVLATAARRFRVRGALVNGAVRDVDELRALAFPTFACGVYPGSMRGRLRLAAVDAPVELDGQRVEAGRFAVADSSGLIVFESAQAERVLAAADARRDRERLQLDAVESGRDPRTVFLRPETGR
jgi:4-hydroxy-4-methyl-2-oxoglutarate aldolase